MYPRHRNRRFLFLPLMLAAFAAAGFVVMLLWNAVLPEVVQVRRLDYPRALGLLLLCRILVGGWRMGGDAMRGGAHAGWQRKWAAMSDEDRERFRDEWKRRCAAKGSRPGRQEGAA